MIGITKFLLCGLIILIALLMLRSIFFIKNEAYVIGNNDRKALLKLGIEALKTPDVPVSSIVLYKGSILGQGFNTVNRDTNLGGHAEINALSDAIKKVGFENFKHIKDSVILITTFEPCMMCKGAMIENGIKNVVFIKQKNLLHWLKNDWKDFKYEYRKIQCQNCVQLQDSLFRLYPVKKN